MSHKAMTWANQQRGLKPSAKLILIKLADHHNPVYGCFPSQELLARECEMSVRSVRNHLRVLEERKLIRRVKFDHNGKRGRSDRYIFTFEEKGALAEERVPVAKNAASSGEEEPRAPANSRQKHRQILPPNLVKEPVKEPIIAGDPSHTQSAFDEFWEAFPRKRNRQRCEKLFFSATLNGVPPSRITAAAKRYRDENIASRLTYIAFADNWLKSERWEDFSVHCREAASSHLISQIAEFWAAKVRDKRYIPRVAISSEIAHFMVSNDLVTERDLQACGVRF